MTVPPDQVQDEGEPREPTSREATNFWALTAEEVATRLEVDPAVGLSPARVERQRRSYGTNHLRELKPPSIWLILRNQHTSPIVALLAIAALLAFAFGQWRDGSAILIVLALNSLIGFYTELRATRSMEALRSLVLVEARVRREGRELQTPAGDLVIGDVVLFEAGDVVTADLRIVEASRVEANESALTGESTPVAKSTRPVEERAPLAERSSMLFKGTAISRGSGVGIVIAVGMKTQLGQIAHLVETASDERTPLEERLSALGRRLIWMTLLVASLTSVSGIVSGKPVLLMIETGIALAVAAIPEGLPIVATMALARGMWRMARQHALINRLSAVETLGATTVIFTDKTGTLTENRMTLHSLVLADGRIELANGGKGPFLLNGSPVDPSRSRSLRAALETSVLCNNASLDTKPGVGDPLEVALLRAGLAAGLDRDRLLEDKPEVREEAFDPETRMMATYHQTQEGYCVAVKGAAEPILGSSRWILMENGERDELTESSRAEWVERIHDLSAEGLRVLAVARRTAESLKDPYRDLTFIGLIALADPPRATVRSALEQCLAAGVQVVMVTGDHGATAANIARAVGLVEDGKEGQQVVLGTELEELPSLSESERKELLEATIFARVTPEQKLELITAYQRAGHIVAMTGDGVNDAPALKKADIGVAMGKRGTQVAREAADMVLTDDAFESIVTAIEQGRIIFGNIRKFIFYLLSCNVSEVMVVGVAAGLGAPLPLLPLQILFLNLVTDVFPAMALAFGEGDKSVLRSPPRHPDEPIMTGRDWTAVAAYGALICTSVLLAMLLAERRLGLPGPWAVTVSFLTLGFAQLWHVFNTRNRGTGVLRNDIVENPWVWGALVLCSLFLVAAVYVPGLAKFLQTEDPGLTGWLLISGMSLVPLVVGQSWKALSWRISPGHSDPRGKAFAIGGVRAPDEDGTR